MIQGLGTRSWGRGRPRTREPGGLGPCPGPGHGWELIGPLPVTGLAAAAADWQCISVPTLSGISNLTRTSSACLALVKGKFQNSLLSKRKYPADLEKKRISLATMNFFYPDKGKCVNVCIKSVLINILHYLHKIHKIHNYIFCINHILYIICIFNIKYILHIGWLTLGLCSRAVSRLELLS